MAERVLVRHLVTTYDGVGEYDLPAITGHIVAVKRLGDHVDDQVVALVEETIPWALPDSEDEGACIRGPRLVLRGEQYQKFGRVYLEIDGHVESVLYA